MKRVIYVASPAMLTCNWPERLRQCKELLQQNPSPQHRRQLELNVKVYETLVNEEPSNKPIPVKLQV